MDRSDILSAQQFLLLSEIYRNEPIHGYYLSSLTGVSRSSIYTVLGRMEEKGLIQSCVVEDDEDPWRNRREYSITGIGLQALELNQLFHRLEIDGFEPENN